MHTYNVAGWEWPEEDEWTYNLTIDNCLFSNCRNGVTWWTTRNSKITGCEIGPISGYPGINFNIKNYNHIIENNTVRNS